MSLHIGESDVTIAVPGAKKFYMGSNFIGLAKGDEINIDTYYNWQTEMNLSEFSSSTSLSGSVLVAGAYGNGKWVILYFSNPANKGTYSTDGLTWTDFNLPIINSSWSDVIFAKNKFIAVGTKNGSIYSSDGINWEMGDLNSNLLDYPKMMYVNGKIYAFSHSSRNYAVSENGINWTSYTLPSFSSSGINTCTYGNGVFLVFGSSTAGDWLYSTDGINWTNGGEEYGYMWTSATYNKGKFIVVGEYMDPKRHRIKPTTSYMYSSDGINWEFGELADSLTWESCSHNDDLFITVPNNSNKINYSFDGINWNSLTISTSRSYPNVIYGDNKFMIIGQNSSYPYFLSLSKDSCYTKTNEPELSTQVYNSPNVISEKTITNVGESSITLSDTKIYNRNPSGDIN